VIGLAAIAFALFSSAGPPCVVAKPETHLLIFLRHIADAVRIPKIGCEQFERNDFSRQNRRRNSAPINAFLTQFACPPSNAI
jgi:hypothetical protein